MAQNRSSAVMAQRQMELLAQEHEDFPGQAKLDDYPTPPWGTRALTMVFDRHRLPYRGRSCWEPSANRGYMAVPLSEAFATVHASDVHDYGQGYRVADFLTEAPFGEADWIIANPPFRLGLDFALRAIELCQVGCAMLVRSAFTEGEERYRALFDRSRPDFNFQFVERLPMVKGRCDPQASTATAYCWLVWLKESPRKLTIQDWIPPCRKQLERANDYPDTPEDAP